MNGISCASGTTTCVAIDGDGSSFYTTDASATGAATWTSWAGPGHRPAEALDCPTTGLCEIVAGEVERGGGSLYYATTLGGAFGTAFLPSNGVEDVSCPSASLCVTARENGFVGWSMTPAGTRWRFEILGSGAMTGVSCVSDSFCPVVDDSGHVHVATTEDGIEEESGWTTSDVDGSTPLTGIACVSISTCLATDGTGEVLDLAIDPASGLISGTPMSAVCVRSPCRSRPPATRLPSRSPTPTAPRHRSPSRSRSPAPT